MTHVVLHKIFVTVALALTLVIALGISSAQDTAPAEARRGVQILLLGTQGGPVLSQRRSQPATLLVLDGRPYLIDCGIGTIGRMLEAGVQSETIGTIFFTHLHPDHALGLADVLANDFRTVDFSEPGTKQRFDVYGPPQTSALVRAAYDYIKIPYGIFAAEPLGARTLIDPFKAHVIDHDGLAYKDDKVRVTAAENTHYQLFPAKYHAAMQSYSYRFDTPYGAVVFTGDTGPSSRVEALAKDADVLISEVEDLDTTQHAGSWPTAKSGDMMAEHMQKEHLPMQAVGELASKAHVKAVILYHIIGGENGMQFVAGVKQYYSGPVFAGEDLARYCLVADTTTHVGKAEALSPCK